MEKEIWKAMERRRHDAKNGKIENRKIGSRPRKRGGRAVRKGPQVSHYRVAASNLPPAFCGFRIVQLSDLHGTLYGRHHQLLLGKIDEEKPDCIVMTGDMADHSRNAISRLVDLCIRLKKRWPVYYAMGNHEQCLKKWEAVQLYDGLKKAGVTVLENTWCDISRQGQTVRLYGLNMPLVYYKDPLGEYRKGAHFSTEDTRKFLGSMDPAFYNILLAHNPLYFPSYRDWGADLTLSGHIHGGIIRIPGLGGVLSPDVTLFPKYYGGHFVEKGKHLIVSRGLGNHFLFRVCNPPELVAITLEKKR